MIVNINRQEFNKNEILGILSMNNKIICYTLENAWHNNEKNISCIPEGIYICKRHNSPKYGETFIITGVEDRTNILIHWGNTHINTKGCILTGSEVGYLDGERAVLSSKKAFNVLMGELKDIDEFILTIGG